MRTGPIAVVLLLIASLAPPLTGGAPPSSVILVPLRSQPTTPPPTTLGGEQVDTTPRTGYYMEVPLRLRYHYDAATDTLTPTADPAVDPYVDVAVYPRGASRPASMLTTSAPTPCPMDFCVALFVAVVNNGHQIRLEMHAEGDCGADFDTSRTYGSNPQEKVQYLDGFWSFNHCGNGKATAVVYLDGFPNDADFTAY